MNKSIRAIFLIALLANLNVIGLKSSNMYSMNKVDYETVTLVAGCFWCVEAIFSKLNGVVKVESGYSGGNISNPTYREVTSGLTGHAEVVQITFNPQIISFTAILEVFFKTHNPTTLNQQGPDFGSQYRSAIFYHNNEQKKISQEIIRELNASGIWNNPIVTEITEYKSFYKAEDYHQDYFKENPNQPYCQMIIVPKLKKLEDAFGRFLKK